MWGNSKLELPALSSTRAINLALPPLPLPSNTLVHRDLCLNLDTAAQMSNFSPNPLATTVPDYGWPGGAHTGNVSFGDRWPRGTHTCGMTCTQEDRPGASPMQALEVASDVLQGIKEFQVP